MDLISVRELFKNTSAYAGKEVTVGGWVRSVRASKQFGFIVLNDGTFFTPVQVVYHDTMDNFNEISKVNVGAALIVKGELLLTPDAKQPFEIQATEVTVEGPSASDYPMQKKRHTVEFLRTMPHLRPRTNMFQAVFRVRSIAAQAIQSGRVEVNHVPLRTAHEDVFEGDIFTVRGVGRYRLVAIGGKSRKDRIFITFYQY